MRPFRIIGIQQVAIGGLDKSKMKHFWSDILGIAKVGEFQSQSDNVDEDILRIGQEPYTVEIDLMQPLDPEGRPKVHEPKLNHIGLWVDDLQAAVKWMSEQGVRFAPGGIRKGASGHDICFVHPKGNDQCPISAEGILLELVQAPPSVIEAFNPKA
jgi:lactoylglutathione lyase